MIRKALVSVAAAAFIFCGLVSLGNASDMGPEEMTLQVTDSKKPKPAFSRTKHIKKLYSVPTVIMVWQMMVRKYLTSMVKK